MQLRLTTPEALDRLIDFLEKERDLVWPEWSGFDKTYRDIFIETVKENMAKDTIFSEIATDDEYVNAELKEKENGN